MDAAGFARKMESAYCDAWTGWPVEVIYAEEHEKHPSNTHPKPAR